MLPTRRTQANLLGDLYCGFELKELSFNKTFVSRASRVDAKLISSNPSLLDKRRSIILPIGLGLRAVFKGGRSFESYEMC